MKKVFVDTGAWIALAERSDVHHPQAGAIADKLNRENTLLMTFDSHFLTAGFELASQI